MNLVPRVRLRTNPPSKQTSEEQAHSFKKDKNIICGFLLVSEVSWNRFLQPGAFFYFRITANHEKASSQGEKLHEKARILSSKYGDDLTADV